MSIFALGVDIGGSFTKMGLVDPVGAIIAFRRIPTTAKGADPAPFLDRDTPWTRSVRRCDGPASTCRIAAAPESRRPGKTGGSVEPESREGDPRSLAYCDYSLQYAWSPRRLLSAGFACSLHLALRCESRPSTKAWLGPKVRFVGTGLTLAAPGTPSIGRSPRSTRARGTRPPNFPSKWGTI